MSRMVAGVGCSIGPAPRSLAAIVVSQGDKWSESPAAVSFLLLDRRPVDLAQGQLGRLLERLVLLLALGDALEGLDRGRVLLLGHLAQGVGGVGADVLV